MVFDRSGRDEIGKDSIGDFNLGSEWIGELKFKDPRTKAHHAKFTVSLIDNETVELDLGVGVVEMPIDTACALAVNVVRGVSAICGSYAVFANFVTA